MIEDKRNIIKFNLFSTNKYSGWDYFRYDNGINLPPSISPFTVNLIGINLDEEKVKNKCNKIYDLLLRNGIDVLFDDRDLLPGVKFKDSDLVGFPVRIIISKKNFEKNDIEIKSRNDSNSNYVSETKLVDYINNIINI